MYIPNQWMESVLASLGQDDLRRCQVMDEQLGKLVGCSISSFRERSLSPHACQLYTYTCTAASDDESKAQPHLFWRFHFPRGIDQRNSSSSLLSLRAKAGLPISSGCTRSATNQLPAGVQGLQGPCTGFLRVCRILGKVWEKNLSWLCTLNNGCRKHATS